MARTRDPRLRKRASTLARRISRGVKLEPSRSRQALPRRYGEPREPSGELRSCHHEQRHDNYDPDLLVLENLPEE